MDAAEGTDPTNPLWVVVLVGALSGVIGAVVGPIIQRTFSRSDKALDARQAWAKEKLRYVFGIGDDPHPSDGPPQVFMRLVPPHPQMMHRYNMHSINWSVEESPDLVLLQPRRSAWARKWLYDWHFRLQEEAQALHGRRHYVDQRFRSDESTRLQVEFDRSLDAATVKAMTKQHEAAWKASNGATRRLEKAEDRYRKRVRRVQSSLAVWATGRWTSKPSLWHLVAISWPARNLLIWRAAARREDKRLDSVEGFGNCDCWERARADYASPPSEISGESAAADPGPSPSA